MELENPNYPNVRLVFASGFDERAAMEAEHRGYLSHVWVLLDRKFKYPVFFYDAVRLAQDLEEYAKSGNAFLAEPAMIVLTAVTLENMFKAASVLAAQGFFDYFRPFDATHEWADFGWPPPVVQRE
jgi:hypothetical protein